MITYIEGDLFSSPAQVIVNTVNTVGVMGKGIALEFKSRYPEMFDSYREMCDQKLLTVGKLMLYRAPDHWILLFPTKENWRNPSKISYIEAGLQHFVQVYANKSINSIAFPRLGCGNGGLAWEDVKPIMEKYLKPLPITVYIYLKVESPLFEPEHKKPQTMMKWLREHAKDMSFSGLKDDIKHLQNEDLYTLYQFTHEGKHISVTWDDDKGIVFTEEKANAPLSVISEDQFHLLWDYIRDVTVFPMNPPKDPDGYVCALLCTLGYLSRISIQGKDGKMNPGYQLNAGLGRAYQFRSGT